MAARNPKQTRERILETAFKEIHAHGFQGMRVDEVIRQSGVQKGAFYHHFKSKMGLGYAVLEEQLHPLVRVTYLDPLNKQLNPLEGILNMLEHMNEHVSPEMLNYGCPLNNLTQEMASQDEGFRSRLESIFEEWITAYTALFEQGKADGYIAVEVDCRAAARFVISVIEGCIGVFKVNHSVEHWVACCAQLASYLKGLGIAAEQT